MKSCDFKIKFLDHILHFSDYTNFTYRLLSAISSCTPPRCHASAQARSLGNTGLLSRFNSSFNTETSIKTQGDMVITN